MGGKIRVLHVVARLDRGGTESWLADVLTRLDREAFQFDFAVNTDAPAALDERIRNAGCRITSCAPAAKPHVFGRRLRALLRSGAYDIVHSHFDPCGFPLQFAVREQVPVRIAHCHNPGIEFRGRPWLARKLAVPLTRRWIRDYATHGLATSRLAGESLFGKVRGFESRWQVLYCGLLLDGFEAGSAAHQVRQQWSIPDDSWIVGHVGKFCRARQKNQEFLLKIAADIVRCDAKVRFVLVGDGPRRQAVEQLAARMGLQGHVVFAGSRGDVHQLLAMFDVFAFPSLFEGLGLAMVEAQAAGIPCVIAEQLPREGVIVPSLVYPCSLQDPQVWVRKLLDIRQSPPKLNRGESLELVRGSAFNVEESTHRLQEFYKDAINTSQPSGIG